MSFVRNSRKPFQIPPKPRELDSLETTEDVQLWTQSAMPILGINALESQKEILMIVLSQRRDSSVLMLDWTLHFYAVMKSPLIFRCLSKKTIGTIKPTLIVKNLMESPKDLSVIIPNRLCTIGKLLLQWTSTIDCS